MNLASPSAKLGPLVSPSAASCNTTQHRTHKVSQRKGYVVKQYPLLVQTNSRSGTHSLQGAYHADIVDVVGSREGTDSLQSQHHAARPSVQALLIHMPIPMPGPFPPPPPPESLYIQRCLRVV